MSDPNFKFGEILNLDFNQFARQFRNIIEQARKDRLIETELENLELFWTSAQLTFEEHRVSPMVYALTLQILQTLPSLQPYKP